MKTKIKGLHSDLAGFSAQIWVKTKNKPKKGLHPDSARFSAQIFGPNSKGGDHDSILRTILMFLCIIGILKGGDHGTIAHPPKYAPDRST